MSFGLQITNDDGYLTFSDTNDYYFYKEKLTSSNATVMFDQRFYWTTSYSGSSVPLVFVYSNGKYCSVMDTFRNANGTWQIHVWCEWGTATATKNALEGYVFVDSSESSSSPAYGIRINNSSGNRVFDSDMEIIKVKDFATVPTASYSSTPSCSYYNSAITATNSSAHGVSGLTKPAALMYSNSMSYRQCTISGYTACLFFRALHKIDGTNITTGWAYMGGLIFTSCNTTTYPFQAFITPVIDGNDY